MASIETLLVLSVYLFSKLVVSLVRRIMVKAVVMRQLRFLRFVVLIETFELVNKRLGH